MVQSSFTASSSHKHNIIKQLLVNNGYILLKESFTDKFYNTPQVLRSSDSQANRVKLAKASFTDNVTINK